MFEKGSRYEQLGESVAVNAEGERLCGKDLRFISTPTGEFLHTIHEGERLDLLAYKYYGDPSRWWQLNDANPQRFFPTELVEDSSIEGERFALTSPDFEKRLAGLLRSLVSLAGHITLAYPALGGALESYLLDLVQAGRITSLGAYDEARSASAFRQATVIIDYSTSATTTYSQVLTQISQKGFHLLDTVSWQGDDGTNAEAFTFDDRQTKCDWQSLVSALEQQKGVRDCTSSVALARLDVFYLAPEISRAEIISLINEHHFQVTASRRLTAQAGQKLVVPPNTIV